MNAYGQLCQADGTSTNEKSSDTTLRRQNYPGGPCLFYPDQFSADSKTTGTRLVRGGGRWGGVRLSSLGTRCIRKVRTVIIYRGF